MHVCLAIFFLILTHDRVSTKGLFGKIAIPSVVYEAAYCLKDVRVATMVIIGDLTLWYF